MKRNLSLSAAFVLALAAIFFARPHATPGPPMRDFEAYYAAGETANAGANPYGTGIWRYERAIDAAKSDRFELLPFISPAPVLPFLQALARLPFASANAVWRGVMLLSIAALILTAAKLRRAPTQFQLGALVCAAVGFGPLTSALALGQLALPAAAFAAAALVFPIAAAAVWIQPNIAIVLLSQYRRPLTLIFAAAGALAVLAASGKEYSFLLAAHGSAERFSAIQLTPAAIVYGFGAPRQLAAFAGYAAMLAAAAAWAYAMRVRRDSVERFCVTCALLPFALPFFHEHDLVVLFIPAAYWIATCAPARWSAFTAAGALCATDWLGLAQRPDGTLQSALLVTAFIFAAFALRDDLAPRELLKPLTVPLAIVALYPAVAAHPLGVWPDAMHVLVPAPFATAAAAWHAEQQAAGLFDRSTLWALLRLFSLLGCVALNVYVLHGVKRRNAVRVEVA